MSGLDNRRSAMNPAKSTMSINITDGVDQGIFPQLIKDRNQQTTQSENQHIHSEVEIIYVLGLLMENVALIE